MSSTTKKDLTVKGLHGWHLKFMKIFLLEVLRLYIKRKEIVIIVRNTNLHNIKGHLSVVVVFFHAVVYLLQIPVLLFGL